MHEGPKTLLKLRAYSDQICKQYGLTTLEPYTGGKSQSLASREYRAAAKGQSWKFSLMNAIDMAMKISGTKQDFIKNMERQGYLVRWEDSRKYITYTCPNTMSCRDIKLHDSRYLKEMMEREFELRRIEAAERRLTASRADPPATAATADRTLSNDTEKVGRFGLQPGSDVGGNRESGEATPCDTGTERIVTHPAEQPAHTGAAGADQQEPIADSADAVTGWEKEREAFFSAEVEITPTGMDGGANLSTVGVGSVAADIVCLGKSVEQLNDPVPIKDCTTKKVVHERKKAVGQKEDDQSGHDFDMTMY